MKCLSQVNVKAFSYQIIEANSIKQQEYCWAVAINKDCSIVAAGCNKLIKIYEFQQGMLKLNQVLNQHKNNVFTLIFMKQQNQLISGDQRLILICNWIRCIILNNNEDLFISSSDDKTIKFWVKKNQWIFQQSITDHSSYVNQLSLNEQQNQVISCGYDGLILVIEQSETNKKWIVKQKIQVDSIGYRLCFINNNLFTFQPINGNLMYLYQINSVSKQFTKSKDITINQGNEGSEFFSFANIIIISLETSLEITQITKKDIVQSKNNYFERIISKVVFMLSLNIQNLVNYCLDISEINIQSVKLYFIPIQFVSFQNLV
ncbi:unnamed protein product [Paramecium pentaurelia]|uniref:Uncharacterized protein n=1 Tax=Paramecium pentaurelia TaxID=43138 RepID=A0A8S1YI05_9CILI|nr:unnamed protein product [Paramecium pentaurelia]